MCYFNPLFQFQELLERSPNKSRLLLAVKHFTSPSRLELGLFRRPQLNNNIVPSTTRAPQDTKAILILLAIHIYTCRPRHASALLHAMHVLICTCIACSTKGSACPSRAFFTLVHFFLAYHEQIQLIAIWRLALLSSRRLLRKRSAENESENYIKDFPA